MSRFYVEMARLWSAVVIVIGRFDYRLEITEVQNGVNWFALHESVKNDRVS